jgi:D-glycero-alpha-D-manno-heptose 1-phosphate guanylyltransferase
MSAAHGDVTALVLAGGRGTRIQAIHPDIPKPMVPVAGKPFLHWLTLWLARHGLDHFVYSTGFRADAIDAWIHDDEFPALTRIARPEDSPLGTGGGLFNSLDACRDWVLVVNGDGLVMGGISELLALRHLAGIDGALLGVDVEDTSRYGSLEIDAAQRLTGFQEKVPGQGTINGGLYLFRKSFLDAHRVHGPSSIERDLFPSFIRRHADLRVVRTTAPFIDIGTPETLRQAETFIRQQLIGRPASPENGAEAEGHSP